MKIGFCITGAYHQRNKSVKKIKELIELGFDVYPVVSSNLLLIEKHYGKEGTIIEELTNLTNHEVVTDIIKAEKFGPINKMDLMIVAPATGNTIAKLANGISDTSVTLAVKATMRNNVPIVIAVSTNDGLSINGENIMKLNNRKGIYFVPFEQDNFINKPSSLISDFNLILPTIKEAMQQNQIQPILKKYDIIK